MGGTAAAGSDYTPIGTSVTFADGSATADVTVAPIDDGAIEGTETVTLSIYADAEGGAPLWQETQTIAVDAEGRYSLLLGAASPDGIPAAVFGCEAAQWLGTVFERRL